MLALAPATGTRLAEARLEQDGVADAAAITARAIAPLAPALGQVEALVDAHHRGTLEDPSPAAQAAIADALRPRLGNLVERVARRVGWDALILPKDTTTRLREMVLYRRHAEQADDVERAPAHLARHDDAHAGEADDARAFARDLIATFERANVDLVAINAAGCGSAMKEYGHLLRDEPAWAGRANAFSRKVRDVSEVLAQLGPARATRHPVHARVAYHDACHLAHAQGVRGAREEIAGPRQRLGRGLPWALQAPQELVHAERQVGFGAPWIRGRAGTTGHVTKE